MGVYDSDGSSHYLFPNLTVSADVTRYIKGPKGKYGLLWDFGVQAITTTFAGGTTTPKMKIGISGTLNKHGDAYDFGTAAAADCTKSIRTAYTEVDAGWATYMKNRNLDRDVQLIVTMVGATGGGAAGVGDFFVEIKWAD